MKFSSVAIITILILICLAITPVLAETLTGEIGEIGVNQTDYHQAPNRGGGGHYNLVVVRDIEKLTNPFAYIQWYEDLLGFDTDAPPGATATFKFELSNFTTDGSYEPINQTGIVVGTGTMGYQRVYDNSDPVNEITPGYVWIQFNNDFNTTGLSGYQWLYLNYTRSNLYNVSLAGGNSRSGDLLPSGAGLMAFYCGGENYGGWAKLNKRTDFFAQYTVSKPSGLGISGSVNKTGSNGITYNSRAFLVDKYYTTLSSEILLTTDTFYFNTNASQIRISMLNSANQWFNSTLIFNETTTPTPTPTPISPGDYDISLSSTYANVNGPINATLTSSTDPSLSGVASVEYHWTTVNSPNDNFFFENGSTSNTLVYSNQGGIWYGWDNPAQSFSVNKGASIPNPVTLYMAMTGTVTVKCLVFTTLGTVQQIQKTVIVGQGQNFLETSFMAQDGVTGGILNTVVINIKNLNTGQWTNATYQSGQGTITVPSGTYLSFYATKTGYVGGQLLNKLAQNTTTYTIPVYTNGTAPSAGNQTFYVTVTSPGGYVGSATVQINEAGSSNTQTKATSASGTVAFILKTNTLYTYTASKPGTYGSASGSFTTDTQQYGFLTITLPAKTTTITIPTTYPSGVPTPIVTGTGGNYTGFWSPFYRGLSGMGANNSELGLLMTMFFVIFALIGGAIVSGGNARVTSGCASAAFILSCAFGWIYFWIIAAGVCWLLASFFLFRE